MTRGATTTTTTTLLLLSTQVLSQEWVQFGQKSYHVANRAGPMDWWSAHRWGGVGWGWG